MPNKMYFVFDVGGTKLKAAVVRADGELSEPVIVPTPPDFSAGLKTLADLARDLAAGESINAAAGGLAGPLAPAGDRLLKSPHLPGWVGEPLGPALSEKLDASVFLENDTAFVGLGEATAGAGRGYPVVGYVTISTGVGGVRIVDGRIDRHSLDFEPGHQVINFTESAGHPCSCGGVGHLEFYVSGAHFENRFGVKPQTVKQTDSAIWDLYAQMLAVGLNNVIVHWSPDVLVLGGSMMKVPGINLERVKTHLRKVLTIFPEPPTVLLAGLGDYGGLAGARAFLRQKFPPAATAPKADR